MSGGHFDYKQGEIAECARMVEKLIAENDDQSPDEWGGSIGAQYPTEIIERFKEAANTIHRAAEMLQRVDWLVSGDDSEKNFMNRWGKEVRSKEQPPAAYYKCVVCHEYKENADMTTVEFDGGGETGVNDVCYSCQK